MTENMTPTEKLVNKPLEILNQPIKAKRVKKIYAIYDQARQAFLGTMEKANHRLALRDFEIMCKDTGSLLNKAKEDFSLYYIGDIDEETGEMIPGKTKLAEATEYVKDTINE